MGLLSKCEAACSEEKRCSRPNMSLYSNPGSGLFSLFYPIASLIKADCILSVFWCLISPGLAGWLKWRPQTWLNWNPSTVVPRRTYTAGLMGLGENCLSQKCVAVFPVVEQKFTFVLKNSSLEIAQACATGSHLLKFPVVHLCCLFHKGLFFYQGIILWGALYILCVYCMNVYILLVDVVMH